ncbi:hypothetical protein [Streptomyces sp. R35]|uniref:Uncharacterized protein n=1 Tax=Streptomyces sp. R35 TaxID=3238630 RepID=A0AB39RU47_9ACTN
MRIRSHVDLCMFTRFMHVRFEDRAPGVDALLADRKDVSALRAAAELQTQASPKVFFHETYHFWQGLRLPFLYRYANLAARAAIHAFANADATWEDLHDWDFLVPDLHRLDLKVTVRLGEDQLSVGPWDQSEGASSANAADWADSATLSPVDLLESAASIAEFQACSGARPDDVQAFRRWAKRHPVYREAFDLACRVLPIDLALTGTIPLINSAFHTSDPVRAFAEELVRMRVLLGRMRTGEGAIREAPLERWSHLTAWLRDELSYESSSEDARLLGSPFHRIHLDNWLHATLNGNPVEHPFLTAPALRWEELARESAADVLLDAPGYAPRDSLDMALKTIVPFTAVRFHRRSDEDIDRVITIGGGGTSTATEDFQIRLMFLTTYSAVRRASGAHFDPDHRLCPHRRCPEWEHNFCNSYPAVPADWHDCKFPENVALAREGARRVRGTRQ